MTLILELPDNKEAALKARALSQGVSAEHFAAQLLDRALDEPVHMSPPSIAHLQITDPEEWGRQLSVFRYRKTLRESDH